MTVITRVSGRPRRRHGRTTLRPSWSEYTHETQQACNHARSNNKKTDICRHSSQEWHHWPICCSESSEGAFLL